MNSPMNFADAPDPMSFDLIPDDTYAWARVTVRPYNAAGGVIETPSRNTQGSRFLDLELELIGGQHSGRKVWDIAMTAHPEGKGTQGGAAAIKAILECNGTAVPGNKESYTIPSYMALDGMVTAVKIGVDPGQERTDQQTGNKIAAKAKNRVKTWLSPYAAATQTAFQEHVQRNGNRPNPPPRQQAQAQQGFQGGGYQQPSYQTGGPADPNHPMNAAPPYGAGWPGHNPNPPQGFHQTQQQHQQANQGGWPGGNAGPVQQQNNGFQPNPGPAPQQQGGWPGSSGNAGGPAGWPAPGGR